MLPAELRLADFGAELGVGRWASTPHRVRLPEPGEENLGRLSIAWFQNLNWDAEISSLVAGEESLYPPITQGQLFWEREGPQRPGRRTDEHYGANEGP